MAGSKNNFTCIILMLCIFFIFILPKLEKKYKNNQEEFASLVLKSTGPKLKIDKNMCSRDCCKWSQYKPPFMKHKKNKYIGSNFMCNNGNGQGCVCFDKKDFNKLANRN